MINGCRRYEEPDCAFLRWADLLLNISSAHRCAADVCITAPGPSALLYYRPVNNDPLPSPAPSLKHETTLGFSRLSFLNHSTTCVWGCEDVCLCPMRSELHSKLSTFAFFISCDWNVLSKRSWPELDRLECFVTGHLMYYLIVIYYYITLNILLNNNKMVSIYQKS